MELVASIPFSNIKKIELYQNTSKLYMSQIKAKTGADYVINGGIYSFKTFMPFGNIKVNGTVVYSPGYGEYGLAWDVGNDVTYTKIPCSKKNYLGCVGMLLSGNPQKLTYNADMGGRRQRSAVGIRGNCFMMYACNGTDSKTPEALQSYAKANGWQHALMLDGGGSTQANFNGQILSSVENSGKGRVVQNYILVYLNKPTTTATPAASKCPYLEPILSVKQGSTGTGVKWVQWYLTQHGYALTIDGVFGKGTLSAVIDFQTKKGLEADGIVGLATRSALKKV